MHAYLNINSYIIVKAKDINIKFKILFMNFLKEIS